MEKTIEACIKCKYSLRRFCINKRCKDCPLYVEEDDDCQCTTIRYCDDCPYYEPAEEVNNAR